MCLTTPALQERDRTLTVFLVRKEQIILAFSIALYRQEARTGGRLHNGFNGRPDPGDPWTAKSFGPVEVMNRFDLDPFPGEGPVLVGDNGRGKSTLIKHVAGVYRADRGKILLAGQ